MVPLGGHRGAIGAFRASVALAVAAPSARNSLPNPVRNPNSTEAALRRLLTSVLR